MKNGTTPPNTATAQDPGTVDNRLSLVPESFPAITDWEDGETYNLSEVGDNITIRQISPGEFEVMPGEVQEEPAPPPRKPGGYKNPAVAALAEEA